MERARPIRFLPHKAGDCFIDPENSEVLTVKEVYDGVLYLTGPRGYMERTNTNASEDRPVFYLGSEAPEPVFRLKAGGTFSPHSNRVVWELLSSEEQTILLDLALESGYQIWYPAKARWVSFRPLAARVSFDRDHVVRLQPAKLRTWAEEQRNLTKEGELRTLSPRRRYTPTDQNVTVFLLYEGETSVALHLRVPK